MSYLKLVNSNKIVEKKQEIIYTAWFLKLLTFPNCNFSQRCVEWWYRHREKFNRFLIIKISSLKNRRQQPTGQHWWWALQNERQSHSHFFELTEVHSEMVVLLVGEFHFNTVVIIIISFSCLSKLFEIVNWTVLNFFFLCLSWWVLWITFFCFYALLSIYSIG